MKQGSARTGRRAAQGRPDAGPMSKGMATRIGIGLALGALSLLCSCSGFYARGYAAYMQPKLTGDIGLSGSGGGTPITGTIDVEDSLGLGEEKSPYIRADVGAAVVSFVGSVFQYDSTGNGTLTANFGDIPIGTPVATDMKILNIKGGAVFNVLDLGFLRLAPGVAVDYFDVDTTVRATSLGAFESVSVQAPVPMLYGQAEVRVGPVSGILDLGWMQANFDEVDGTWWDVEGMVRISPIEHLEIMAGYRWISVDSSGTSEGQDYVVDMQLEGWYLGGGVTF